MEAIQSNTGPSAVEYVLIALSVTLLLSVSLAGGLAIPRQYEAPNACSSQCATRIRSGSRLKAPGACAGQI